MGMSSKGVSSRARTGSDMALETSLVSMASSSVVAGIEPIDGAQTPGEPWIGDVGWSSRANSGKEAELGALDVRIKLTVTSETVLLATDTSTLPFWGGPSRSGAITAMRVE